MSAVNPQIQSNIHLRENVPYDAQMDECIGLGSKQADVGGLCWQAQGQIRILI
jgi:hypothetical protein